VCCFFLLVFQFNGHHPQILCDYCTWNFIFARPTGNMWQYTQCDWLSWNHYNEGLLGLKIYSDWCLRENLKTLMWLINETYLFSVSFLKVRCGLYSHKYGRYFILFGLALKSQFFQKGRFVYTSLDQCHNVLITYDKIRLRAYIKGNIHAQMQHPLN
jgi:hypothetical protein